MNFSPAYQRDIKINEATLSNQNLKRLFETVHVQLEKAINLQINNIDPNLFEDFDEIKNKIHSAYKISYTVTKKLGDSIIGYDMPDLASSHFPEQIESLYISTKNVFRASFQFEPRNNIEIFIDFRKARLSIDFITLPSNPTLNESNASISGVDEHWVIESYEKLKEFFDARSNGRIFIHRSGIYDIFLYAFVIPVFLYVCYRIEIKYLNFVNEMPKITIVAIYIYALLCIGLLSRLLFQYARWLFPLVEYTSDRRWGGFVQRAMAITILLGLVVSVVYDAIGFFLL